MSRHPDARRRVHTAVLAFGLLVAVGSGPALAQVMRHPEDVHGIAIPYPRVRLIHSLDRALEGSTGHLRAYDPFLLYQLGKDLVHMQFRRDEGACGRPGDTDVPLYPADVAAPNGDVPIPRLTRDHVMSCAFCHSIPRGEPGAGQTISSTGGRGRSTPHFYGAGLVEQIGLSLQARVLGRLDLDRDGIVSRREATASGRLRFKPEPSGDPIDFGTARPGPMGVPQLNPAFRIWYVDREGSRVKDAISLRDPRVFGFRFSLHVFGWGRGYRDVGGTRVALGGESATVRDFYTVAADVHMGLQAFDPSQDRDVGPDEAGPGDPRSLSEARLVDVGRSVDRGSARRKNGLSLDDPDGDGVVTELTQGDVDAAEFYMLHAPAPARIVTSVTSRGEARFEEVGCARCHVPNWKIPARDPAKGFAGDRRFFDLRIDVATLDPNKPRLRGELVRLSREGPNGLVPLYGDAWVRGVFSDFKHWDIGPAFHEIRFDGSTQRVHRTAPLWGVGSTAPYGHSARFPSLEAVVVAHAGEAVREREAFEALPPGQRRDLLAFLRSLVLYDTTDVAVDIDGDGRLSDDYRVGGSAVGFERFDPRFLFAVPPKYRTVSDATDMWGRARPHVLIDNVAETYRMDLDFRRDADGDGFPDRMDPTPNVSGLTCAADPQSPPFDHRPSSSACSGWGNPQGISDATGMTSRENRRVIKHSDAAGVTGSALDLQQTDPWLAYQLGRSYFHREFTKADGVFDALPKRSAAGSATSCALCHNLPFGGAGAGGNTNEPVGFGKNTPHLYGAGLMESLGIQIQAEILWRYDRNRNGFIDVPKESEGRFLKVEASPGVSVDFGYLGDHNRDGWPDLNSALVISMVDDDGRVLKPRSDEKRHRFGEPGVAGYSIAVGTFASSAGDHQFQSLRAFSVGVIKTVFGLQVVDPTTANDSGERGDRKAGDGWAVTSIAGAPQQHFPPMGVDAHQARAFATLERNAYAAPLPVGEGELDLLEWYLLNHPPPAPAPRTAETDRGRLMMDEFKCTVCHVDTWVLRAADDEKGFPGDRRFFDLILDAARGGEVLSAVLVPLWTKSSEASVPKRVVPRRLGKRVEGLFTDFLHHDLGSNFHEHSYAGGQSFTVRRTRTAPLWGIGSTPPYGTRGRSPTLDNVIRRHGGEAKDSRDAYVNASSADRAILVGFLSSLTLYDPLSLPVDLDRDGRITNHFERGGHDLGPERLRPELLFQHAPRYRGWTDSRRQTYSYELVNFEDAYRLSPR